MPDLIIENVPLTKDLEREIHELVTAYYEPTVAKTDIPPYDFVWPQYEAMEQIGALCIVTGRYDRLLVGLDMYIVLEHPHHAGMLVAECDTIATRLEFRGHGIARRLYLYSEPVLKARGVQKVIHRYRHVYGAKPIFESLGFKAIETCYMKEIG